MNQKIKAEEKKKYFEKCSKCGKTIEVGLPSYVYGYAVMTFCRECEESAIIREIRQARSSRNSNYGTGWGC
ncbi:hypothetical protein KAJ61_01225 [Candidatus Parcubacteria bacterium]|nr:hypothetical protein [Candidatus Parcubacteria bacterium]MCK5510934.1 hypothetical protein [Candidatus Parcubacteria bacterium]